MPQKQEKRNQFVVKLYEEGMGTGYIQDKLEDAGYNRITRTRIWSIIRQSGSYVPRNMVTRFCHFCLQNKQAQLLYFGKKASQHKTSFRMCEDCLIRLMPKQPITSSD